MQTEASPTRWARPHPVNLNGRAWRVLNVVVLNLWLLSGLAPRAAWLASLVFFALGAAANLYLALEGQRSCGCFGRVEVSPWWTALADLLVVFLLMTISAPALYLEPARTSSFRTTNRLLVAALPLLLCVALITDFVESLDFLPSMQKLSMVPRSIELGDGRHGDVYRCEVLLRNHTGSPLRVYGGTTTCRCVATDDLPVVLDPGASHPITIRFQLRGLPGRFKHHFLLFTDDEGAPLAVGSFNGRILPSPSSGLNQRLLGDITCGLCL